MNPCVNGILGLFQGTTQCPAICLAVASFVLGLIVMCVVCRLFRPCGRKSCGAARKAEGKRGEDKPFEKRKPHPAPADGSIEIYVGNLSYEMTEEQLRKEFEAYGTVNSVRLVTHRPTGRSKGFGFVQMPNRAEAEKACAALNDREIQGRKIKCNEAKNVV